VPDSEFHRLGRMTETMLALAKNDDLGGAITIWDGLDERE
jgi:hypothetical protein